MSPSALAFAVTSSRDGVYLLHQAAAVPSSRSCLPAGTSGRATSTSDGWPEAGGRAGLCLAVLPGQRLQTEPCWSLRAKRRPWEIRWAEKLAGTFLRAAEVRLAGQEAGDPLRVQGQLQDPCSQGLVSFCSLPTMWLRGGSTVSRSHRKEPVGAGAGP